VKALQCCKRILSLRVFALYKHANKKERRLKKLLKKGSNLIALGRGLLILTEKRKRKTSQIFQAEDGKTGTEEIRSASRNANFPCGIGDLYAITHSYTEEGSAHLRYVRKKIVRKRRASFRKVNRGKKVRIFLAVRPQGLANYLETGWKKTLTGTTGERQNLSKTLTVGGGERKSGPKGRRKQRGSYLRKKVG